MSGPLRLKMFRSATSTKNQVSHHLIRLQLGRCRTRIWATALVPKSAGSDQYLSDRVRETHESLERAEADGHSIGSINEMPSPPLVGHEEAGQQTDLEVDSHVDGENVQSEPELARPSSAPNERIDCSTEGDADGRRRADAMSDSTEELGSTDIERVLRLMLRKLEDPW